MAQRDELAIGRRGDVTRSNPADETARARRRWVILRCRLPIRMFRLSDCERASDQEGRDDEQRQRVVESNSTE